MSESSASTGQNAHEQRPSWTSQAWTNSTQKQTTLEKGNHCFVLYLKRSVEPKESKRVGEEKSGAKGKKD